MRAIEIWLVRWALSWRKDGTHDGRRGGPTDRLRPVSAFWTQSLLNSMLPDFGLVGKGEGYFAPRDCVQKIAWEQKNKWAGEAGEKERKKAEDGREKREVRSKERRERRAPPHCRFSRPAAVRKYRTVGWQCNINQPRWRVCRMACALFPIAQASKLVLCRRP